MHRAVTSLIVLLLLSGPADAADRVRIGVELTFFQAAAPIAMALAAGQIDVGATGLTAALYNIVLGGERLWIVADKGRGWPGYPLTAIVVVQKDLCDLKGRRIGVTQLGNALEKDGLTLSDVKIAPLQAMSAALEAGRILAWAGDVFPWQCCVVVYGKKFAAERERALAFMRGYVTASRHDYDAVLRQKDGRPQPGASYDEVVAIAAKYTGATPDVIRIGFPYQGRNGRFLAEDIEKQIS